VNDYAASRHEKDKGNRCVVSIDIVALTSNKDLNTHDNLVETRGAQTDDEVELRGEAHRV
jgi:hypothetical protein